VIALPIFARGTIASVASGPRQARCGKRHYGGHDDHARVREARSARGERNIQERLARQRLQKLTHCGGMLASARSIGEKIERQQDEPEADRNSSKILQAVSLSCGTR